MRVSVGGPSSRRCRGDDGSLVVALLVIMVLTSLSATVLTRTLFSMTSVMQDTNYEASKAQADAALSDALFRIDQFGENDTTSFCVGPSNSYCSLSSIPAAPGGEYTARRLDDNNFLVRAQGLVNKGMPFTLQANVSRQLLFPYAIYAVQGATFNGSSDAITTDDSNFPANIGSAGTITCNGSGTYGSGQYSNSAASCPSPHPMTTTYNPQDPSTSATCTASNDTNPAPSPPIPCVPSGTQSCPTTFDSTTSGQTYSGTYLCTSSVTFSDTINVAASGLYVYFVPNSGATLTFASGRNGSSPLTVNPVNSPSNPAGGDPTKFALYAGGTNSVTWSGDTFTMNGTLWAPHTDMTGNGCKMSVVGAIVVQSLTCNGGGGTHLALTYDNRLQTEVQKNWTVTNYQVTGITDFALPTCSAASCY